MVQSMVQRALDLPFLSLTHLVPLPSGDAWNGHRLDLQTAAALRQKTPQSSAFEMQTKWSEFCVKRLEASGDGEGSSGQSVAARANRAQIKWTEGGNLMCDPVVIVSV
jgi:hypothetical protein